MNLVIDIGNTKMAFGVFEEDTLVSNWSLKTDTDKTADEYALLLYQMFGMHEIALEECKGAMACSVVPQVDRIMKEVLNEHFDIPLHFVGPGVKTGLNILYENPREVGADRITNAVAALEKYGPPFIVVDFGTATTYCYVNEKGQYLGGAITPGMGIAIDALTQKASKLPRIETATAGRVIGRSTVEALQSGCRYGLISEVEGMILRIQKEAGRKAPVVATGREAGWIKSETAAIQWEEEFLTLEGLQFIYQKNQELFF
jgi:type III pantothenate kinase